MATGKILLEECGNFIILYDISLVHKVVDKVYVATDKSTTHEYDGHCSIGLFLSNEGIKSGYITAPVLFEQFKILEPLRTLLNLMKIVVGEVSLISPHEIDIL